MAAVSAHTEACRAARTGARHRRDEERPDYPWMSDVRASFGQEGVDAVLACPSPEHDTTRFICLGRDRP